jgi:Alr-MurF fusion protein
MIRFSELGNIVQGEVLQQHRDREIRQLFIDSRKTVLSDTALFFSIKGERHDGHDFIGNLYASGIRQFVIEQDMDFHSCPEANFIKVPSSVRALQAISAYHRGRFSIPVIGITGSNGKTIIKEWLYQLLYGQYAVVKNPGSYNSQTGVPLSVWQMQSHHELGIFEAGISQPGEMELLQKIIQPTIGIFTNLGSAHDEGFTSEQQKIEEKLKLFTKSEALIFCADHLELASKLSAASTSGCQHIGWGTSVSAEVQVHATGPHAVDVVYNHQVFRFTLPFSDDASRENILHCVVTLLYLKVSEKVIQEGINLIKAVPMRLELKQGINQCQLIDDTYNNDLEGLQISLNFLSSIQKKKKTLILSDIFQSGADESSLAEKINNILETSEVSSFIGIGKALHRQQHRFEVPIEKLFFTSTQEFIDRTDWDRFHQEVILVKGARAFQFEKIVRRLQRKIHGTVMEISVDALVNNLNYFKAALQPGVKLMVMVKAFAYGSGSEEVASLLQYHNTDYLGVAYADEGVELRKNRISIPIMVMNPQEENFETLLAYDLEPEIYSLRLLHALSVFLGGRACRIHLKIDTGMHRLGFNQPDLPELITVLRTNTNIQVASIFSHLAGADDRIHDDFSRDQARQFLLTSEEIKKRLSIRPILHLLNSPGILRFPDLQLDMVRLGIGLYGINPTEEKIDQLKPAATLKTIISQIRKVRAGESVGYGRRGKAEEDMNIATIAIGYADGFSRSFSRGKGIVLVNGKKAPVVGNVCMDMTMIDITGIEAREGDEVIIFGRELPILDVASRIDTIPYEILTNTSERVKRVFYAESI